MELFKRGDIYWINLNPAEGSGIGKTRPAVIAKTANLKDDSKAKANQICPPIFNLFNKNLKISAKNYKKS
ncbi:MAG: type II toxin-antitoxin system PemK/MazF family toxin [Deltaproteobacteria bacterium]|jgi:hypothetical protein|nr:type II toxin-antitoxin system PemK/MazF family toxin [Deltaproteobacteria bacterium]